MCEANSWSPAKDYEENLRTLRRRRFADTTFEENAKRLWARRDDYHHLNPTVATELTELENIALWQHPSLGSDVSPQFHKEARARRLNL